jgi:hypothetical protein
VLRLTKKGYKLAEVFQIVRCDIEASIKAFEANDFENMNMFTNRSMANAILGEDKKLVLPGFFMKELVIIFGALEARGGREQHAFSTAKTRGLAYVKLLSQTISEKDFDENKLWAEFHEANSELGKFLMNEFEEETYKEDNTFSEYAFKWLMDFLEKEKHTLSRPENMLLKGILNDMDRIFRIHGGTLHETYAFSLVRALSRYYDYFIVAHRKNDGTIDEEKIQSMIFPHVEKIKSMYLTKETKALAVTEVLWELVKGWRELFIEYMELRRPTIEVERGVELPEEAKRKITESITKSLEKEVGVKKGKDEK